MDARVNGAWQVVHGILAFGPDLPLATSGGRVEALPWLLGGGSLAGWRVRPAPHGLFATIEEGSTTGQGHPDQWMGYLSQCGSDGLPADTAITVAGRRFTLADLLSQAQADIRPGREATWTLMALARWLPPDASWTAGDGRSWTVEDVARMEAEAAVNGAACGGAHRLYALATALAAERRINQQQQHFIEVLSHEVRTPLAQIDSKSDVPPQVQMQLAKQEQVIQQMQQQMQVMGLDIQYRQGVEQIKQQGETQRELMRQTAKAHNTETMAEVKVNDQNTRSITSQNKVEIEAIVELLLHNMDTARLNAEIDRRNAEQARSMEFAASDIANNANPLMRQ